MVGGEDEGAHDDVRVAVDVLSERVHDDVRAEDERGLVERREEGVVDEHKGARRGGAREGDDPRDVDQAEGRVRRGLNPDELSVGAE